MSLETLYATYERQSILSQSVQGSKPLIAEGMQTQLKHVSRHVQQNVIIQQWRKHQCHSTLARGDRD